MASALAKPRGVMLVPAGVERAVLAPLPVRSFPGIGPVAEGKLHAAGYQTLGAVADAPVAALREIFGAWAPSIQRGVQGQGSGALGRERPAFSEHDPEGETVGSISNERTFREDVPDPATIESVLCGLCERVCWRARKRRDQGAHRDPQAALRRLPHADPLAHARRRPARSWSSTRSSRRCWRRRARGRCAVRLLGVQLSNLGVYEQLSLFDHHEQAGAVVDQIRERYGFSMVALATQLGGAGKKLVGRRSVGRGG